MDDAAAKIEEIRSGIKMHIENQMIARGFSAATVLYNNTQLVLRGRRSGRVYKIPDTYDKHMSKATKAMKKEYGHQLRGGVLYRASAPGEPPANRKGIFCESWRPETHTEGVGDNIEVHSSAVSTYSVGGRVLGRMLQNGTKKVAPRPYMEKVREKSKKQIYHIYSRPYF